MDPRSPQTDELALLKEGLGTEIRRACTGELPGSVVVLIRDDRLPMEKDDEEAEKKKRQETAKQTGAEKTYPAGTPATPRSSRRT